MWGVLFRLFVGLFIGGAGVGIGIAIASTSEHLSALVFGLAFGIGGYAVGYLVAPFTARPLGWIKRRYIRVSDILPTENIVAASVGLAFALVLAALLAVPLSNLSGVWGDISPFIAAVILSLFFVPIMAVQGRPVLRFFFRTSPIASAQGDSSNDQIILDTSAIIDGRIADVVQTGFVQGTLVIPRFVLDELRHIADSSDLMRRTRGRRGLEMLNQLQRGSDVPVQISDADFLDTLEVDSKLVKLAKMLRCSIVSNDYNLGKAAELEGVRILNINELANALKPVVLPGEDLALRIVQEGKEPGQGVGFLDDGTMVVVENGRKYLNTDLSVAVTRVLQTSAGRMIFAQPKGHVEERAR